MPRLPREALTALAIVITAAAVTVFTVLAILGDK